MTGSVDLSLVVPAFREGAALGRSLRVLREASAGWPGTFEVIAAIHSGQEATRAAAEEVASDWSALRVITVPQPSGKGAAVRTGVQASRGRWVAFTDMDLSVPPGTVAEVPARLDAGVSVIIATRRGAGSVIDRPQPGLRQVVARGFNALVRLATGLPFRDTQCGFKAFTREAADAIFARQRLDGFAFDVEVLLLARELGFRVEELPVHWRNGDSTSVSVPRDVLKMGFDVLRLGLRFGRGKHA